MTINHSYALTASDRKRRARLEKRLESLEAERRKKLEDLVRDEESRREKRRLAARG